MDDLAAWIAETDSNVLMDAVRGIMDELILREEKSRLDLQILREEGNHNGAQAIQT